MKTLKLKYCFKSHTRFSKETVRYAITPQNLFNYVVIKGWGDG